jgi:hypothetical protein
VGRPCAHPFCHKQIPDSAPRNKLYHDDPCGRDARRLAADPGYQETRGGEAFWAAVGRVRRLAPGQALKSGTPRQVSPQSHREVVA